MDELGEAKEHCEFVSPIVGNDKRTLRSIGNNRHTQFRLENYKQVTPSVIATAEFRAFSSASPNLTLVPKESEPAAATL